MEQIEDEGNDPATEPPPSDDEGDEGDLLNNLESEDWGGSEKSFTKDEPREDDGKVQKDIVVLVKESSKGKSPLATNKASTLVAREGIIDQLKRNLEEKLHLLSEENIIEESKITLI